jgi:hypothetical protein
VAYLNSHLNEYCLWSRYFGAVRGGECQYVIVSYDSIVEHHTLYICLLIDHDTAGGNVRTRKVWKEKEKEKKIQVRHTGATRRLVRSLHIHLDNHHSSNSHETKIPVPRSVLPCNMNVVEENIQCGTLPCILRVNHLAYVRGEVGN